MATSGIRPSTEGALLLKSLWDPAIKLKAQEEGVLAQDIPKGNVEKIGDTWYIRILPTVTIRSGASTDQYDDESLTWETGTVTRVSGTPTRKYAAVQFPVSMTEALVSADKAAMLSGYRDQGTAGLVEALDIGAAGLWANLITNVKGPFDASKTTLLSMRTSLKTSAKKHAKKGSNIHVVYHTSQDTFVSSISEIMNADARGGGDTPNVDGIIVKAWGMTLSDTGSIINSGGSYKNLMFLDSAFAKAFNVEPGIYNQGQVGLVYRIRFYMEYSFVEVFDEDALVWQSV